jgi:NitT/TauT family transport system ATP-binding protein
MPIPTVELDHATMVFATSRGPLTALKDVSFDVAEGEFVSLIGPSGCGKSTILRLVSAIHEPTGGSVRVVGEAPERARKKNEITLMFQEPVLLPWLTVYKNVIMALELTRPANHPDPMEVLAFVGLGGRDKDYPNQLSGGMQQRVALARALVTNPRVLLMDEPFAALDELTRDRMGLWLLRVWEQTRKTVLFVTHSIPEAIYLSDRVVVLDAHPGRLRAIVDIPLPRPRTEETRQSLQFFELLGTLREHLRATERREVTEND